VRLVFHDRYLSALCTMQNLSLHLVLLFSEAPNGWRYWRLVRIRFESRKISRLEKCLKMPQTPSRPVHALLGMDLKTRCSAIARLAAMINAFFDFRQDEIACKNESHHEKRQAMNDNQSRKNLPITKTEG